MCCFIVPLTQAVATTMIRKKTQNNGSSNSFITQLPKLELMLWGGSAMLVVDHIINGELTWQYPFFTAMEQKDGIYTMLQEMLCVGVPMSLLVTALYGILAWKSYKKNCKA